MTDQPKRGRPPENGTSPRYQIRLRKELYDWLTSKGQPFLRKLLEFEKEKEDSFKKTLER